MHVFLSLLLGTATAGELDLTITSTSGCGPEWYGACLPNDVWGATDVFGVATPTTIPVLTIGASATSASKIAIAQSNLNNNPALSFTVKGRALSVSTKISMETRFYNSLGAILATHTDVLHQGDDGLFSVNFVKENLPNNAHSWKTRLVVEGGAATISHAGAGCWLGGCQPPEDWNPPDAGDTGGCVECDVDCGDYTALGQQCGNEPCTAECNGVFGEGDLAPQEGVDLNP